ncbi:MAG: DUF1822 family protein [Cyanobacteria bacterium J06597_1]
MMYDSTHYDEKSHECPDFGSIDNSDTGDRNGSRLKNMSGERLGTIPLDRLAMEGVVSSGDWDFESLPTAGVQMQEAGIQQAGRLSQSVVWPDRQWSTYLQGLAVLGFEDWLRLHSNLSVGRDRCSTFQPALANVLSAACNLSVDQFQLCVIPIGALGDDRIEIPRAAIDLPQFSAHFYVLVEVLEDCGYVQVLGMALHQQLTERCRNTVGITGDRGEESWSYFCPTAWFEYSKDDLLLWLRAADASQIELPPALPLPVSMPLRARMQQVQSQLATRPIWQVLDWSEAMPLLVNPGWANWLLETAKGLANLPLPLDTERLEPQLDTSAAVAARKGNLPTIESAATGTDSTAVADERFLNRALNVGMWLHDRMGALAEELAWIMMAPSVPHAHSGSSQIPSELVVGMRDIEDDVDAVIGQLLLDGLDIPISARGAYRQLEWGDRSLRLYALTWPHLSANNEPEWTLLVVLGPTPGQSLPARTRLRVRDATQLLVEQTSSERADDSYLYAHVIGAWDEQFWVTIDTDGTGSSADSGSAIYLPPFQFKPGVVQL